VADVASKMVIEAQQGTPLPRALVPNQQRLPQAAPQAPVGEPVQSLQASIW
jgi:hypothetical protein